MWHLVSAFIHAPESLFAPKAVQLNRLPLEATFHGLIL